MIMPTACHTDRIWGEITTISILKSLFEKYILKSTFCKMRSTEWITTAIEILCTPALKAPAEIRGTNKEQDLLSPWDLYRTR